MIKPIFFTACFLLALLSCSNARAEVPTRRGVKSFYMQQVVSLNDMRGKGFSCAELKNIDTGRTGWESGTMRPKGFQADRTRIKALQGKVKRAKSPSTSLRKRLERLKYRRRLCKRAGPKYLALPPVSTSTPAIPPLEISAGEDRLIIDEDENGEEIVTLAAEVQPRTSGYKYLWREDGEVLADSAESAVAVSLPLGMHRILLSVTDLSGRNADVEVRVSVVSKERPSSAVGANLGGLSDYSSAIPFVDLMRTSRKWVDPDWAAATVPLDENGWPSSLGSYPYLQTLMVRSTKGPFPTGTYSVFYEGHGTMIFSFAAVNQKNVAPGKITFEVVNPSDAGILLKLSSIDPSDPLRNIRVIMPGHEETYRRRPFNPQFLEHVKKFGVIRFMDWMTSNHAITLYSGAPVGSTARSVTLGEGASTEAQAYTGKFIQCVIKDTGQHARMISNYDGATRTALLTADWEPGYLPDAASQCEVITSYAIHWEDRMKPSYASWHNDRVKGAPLEIMVQLSNTAGVDPWFNLPYMASDDYVRQFATYVRDHLDPRRKIYLEYSNELWNVAHAFRGQSGYAIAKGMELGLAPGNRWHAGRRYRAVRSVEIAKIFSDVFGEAHVRADRAESRILRLLPGQTGGVGSNTSSLMDVQVGGRPAHEYMDALAIADYYSGITLDDLERSGVVPQGLGDHTQMKLPADWSSASDIYTGRRVTITSGAAEGNSRTIVGYDGATRTAAVDLPFTAPIEAGSSIRLESKSIDALLDQIQADVNRQYSAPNGNILKNVINAKARGLDTVVYEGGTHTDAARSFPDTDPANVMLDAVNRHPRMREIALSSLQYWKGLGMDANGRGPGIWCAYVAIGRWSKFGRWGHLEHVYQNPSDSPRWTALMEFAGANPPWWGR